MNDHLQVYNQLLTALTYWLRIFGVAVILGETAFLLFRYKKIFYKETLVNLATGAFAVLAQTFIKTYIIFDLHLRVYDQFRLFDPGIHWYTFVTGFLLYTFIQYATHYYNHKIRIFWCLHEVHHSATQMNATAGLRGSVFDLISLDIFYLLMPLLGIHPIVYLLLYTCNKFWGTVIHVNENIINKIPALEKIITTPSNHHIHHASNPEYIDRNFGEVVPWFDMLFRTYTTEREPPVYGTTHVRNQIGFWESQVHEFRRLGNDIRNTSEFKNKIRYCFKPPGWHP